MDTQNVPIKPNVIYFSVFVLFCFLSFSFDFLFVTRGRSDSKSKRLCNTRTKRSVVCIYLHYIHTHRHTSGFIAYIHLYRDRNTLYRDIESQGYYSERLIVYITV